jgi:hypothetical protein
LVAPLHDTRLRSGRPRDLCERAPRSAGTLELGRRPSCSWAPWCSACTRAPSPRTAPAKARSIARRSRGKPSASGPMPLRVSRAIRLKTHTSAAATCASDVRPYCGPGASSEMAKRSLLRSLSWPSTRPRLQALRPTLIDDAPPCSSDGEPPRCHPLAIRRNRVDVAQREPLLHPHRCLK